MLTKNIQRLRSRTILGSFRAASFHSSKPLNEVVSTTKLIPLIILYFQLTVRDCLRQAMVDEMRRDKNVFLMGEEVGQY